MYIHTGVCVLTKNALQYNKEFKNEEQQMPTILNKWERKEGHGTIFYEYRLAGLRLIWGLTKIPGDQIGKKTHLKSHTAP